MAHDHEQQSTSPLIPAIGAVTQVERMFRVNWVTSLVRSPSGIPMLPAEFVARVGRSVRLVDVREREELVGPLGHIPGVDWVPRELVSTLLARLDHDAPVVLISRGGERSGELAKQLEREGMRLVASLEGGMVSWKGLGFGTSRNPEILERRDQLRTIEPAPEQPGELTVERIERHVGDPSSVPLRSESVNDAAVRKPPASRVACCQAASFHVRSAPPNGRCSSGPSSTWFSTNSSRPNRGSAKCSASRSRLVKTTRNRSPSISSVRNANPDSPGALPGRELCATGTRTVASSSVERKESVLRSSTAW
jgi:rhodanese-related sulfurtransferase